MAIVGRDELLLAAHAGEGIYSTRPNGCALSLTHTPEPSLSPSSSPSHLFSTKLVNKTYQTWNGGLIECSVSLCSPQLDGFFRKTQGCPNCGPHKNSFALNESRNAIHRHNGPNSCLTQPYRTGRIFPSAEICLCECVVLLGCLANRAFPIMPVVFVDVSPPLLVLQQQYHSKIDVLIDEAFKEMISSLVSKVLPADILSASIEPPHFTTLKSGFCPFFSAGLHC